MKLPRFYQNLEKYLKPNKVLVIYGSRQAGKTTLLKSFLARTKLKYKLDSGDSLKTQEILNSQDFSKITEYVSGYELLAVDEAQRIPNVGQGLKIIVDQVPGIKVIATGSSSFELAGQIGEPLTGRKRTLTLFPLSQIELSEIYNPHEIKERLPEWLVFGGYPEAVTAKTRQEKKGALEEIVNSYLLKDILELEKVKGSKILLDLLRLLAFQIGSEVSLTELGEKLALDYKTVGRYLDLLEKSFVIFSLRGFSKNLRKEITKKANIIFLTPESETPLFPISTIWNCAMTSGSSGKIFSRRKDSKRRNTEKFPPIITSGGHGTKKKSTGSRSVVRERV